MHRCFPFCYINAFLLSLQKSLLFLYLLKTEGRFFHSKFTRSYEGSSCVFFTTAIVVAANFHAFTATQF